MFQGSGYKKLKFTGVLSLGFSSCTLFGGVGLFGKKEGSMRIISDKSKS
jgi:hypothetical protein